MRQLARRRKSLRSARPMRIAQIAPLAESVPPKLYGGTERVVAWLVDELVELGHEVTLFASGDSKTRGELRPVWPRALRLGRPHPDPNAVCAMLLEAVAGRARGFDIIHSHVDWAHLPVLARSGTPLPEPFGLVMIEAMACGTPVIAYRAGSVPEVIENGVNGFIVDNEDEAIRALKQLDRIDRRTVRAHFEQRFTAERMARAYEGHYRKLVRASAEANCWP